jgi:TolA-binding protein
MIKYRKAPAGYIAQYFTDEKLPLPGSPNQNYLDNQFLDVTGFWSSSLEDALMSVKKQRPVVIKKLQKKLEKLESKVNDLRTWIEILRETSDEIVEGE